MTRLVSPSAVDYTLIFRSRSSRSAFGGAECLDVDLRRQCVHQITATDLWGLCLHEVEDAVVHACLDNPSRLYFFVWMHCHSEQCIIHCV